MNKHTPGPWSFKEAWSHNGFGIWEGVPGSDERRNTIAEVFLAYGIKVEEQKGVAEANARLIASSPALLEALSDLLVCAEYHARMGLVIPLDNEHITSARAAISKATA